MAARSSGVSRSEGESVRVRFEDGAELELAHEAEGVWTAVRPDATRSGSSGAP